MEKIFIYNTMSREKEEFKSLHSGQVGIYTCGPTVYNYAHIGNLRSYIFSDSLRRVFEYNGYEVKHVVNITDVGHLVDDGDMGEDKMEKGSKREGKTAWEIAEFYTKAFKEDFENLNIKTPSIWCKVTDHIPEQIELIQVLETKGYTYKTSDGVYYDTSKFLDYNKLSHLNLEELREGARVEKNEEKKNPTDFALWKFSPVNEQRQMEWESPWGKGFPGWHIECSAMSMKYLDGRMDIHTGGIDHINVHHTNEIAQSEAATGEKFFNYWMHSAFLNVIGGKKMAKSDDNFLTLENALLNKGMSPLVYRFAALQVHYRKPMEYSEDSLKNTELGFKHLQNQIRELGGDRGVVNCDFKNKFLDAINDDLNMPRAMSILQELLKSKLEKNDKLTTILDFDKVLGLNLDKVFVDNLPKEVLDLISQRKQAKENKNWEESDRLRDKIVENGYLIEDTDSGIRVIKK